MANKIISHGDTPLRAVDNADGTYSLATTAVLAGDIEIGAVELKNAADDTRAKVGALTGLASSDNGLPVASYPIASEVHLGAVGGNTAIVAPTITVTAGAYTANDVVGGVVTLTGAARVSGTATTLTRLSLMDAANQKAQLEILFFNANPSASTFTNDAAPVIHANDIAKYVGRVTVYASDYVTINSKALVCLANIGLAMKPVSADLYMVICTPGTPTYAATSDLTMSLAFYQD